MTTDIPPEPTPDQELSRVVESARRLGVEIDEAEARRWLEAMAVQDTGLGDVVLDTETGVYGHAVSMLDFSPKDLDRFRQIAAIVEIPDRPGQVETAIALSGSAAQSRIQTYPGDADFFERINILAPTREDACAVLAEVMRQKILETLDEPTHRFIEAKFGNYPRDVEHGGKPRAKGSPITWNAREVQAGRIEVQEGDGSPGAIGWGDVANDPGWCKLDWIVADPIRRRLCNASNMFDATWEAPDGSITPLDGYLDPYFQEVYLESESIPVFSKVAKHLMADALDNYVGQLEHEIHKYANDPANYGKVAKRMYNVFRLTGSYDEAAYLRELFDEPATVLYQVAALIRSLDEAAGEGSDVPIETLVAQADDLIDSVQGAVRDDLEVRIVDRLTSIRENLLTAGDPADRAAHVKAAVDEVSAMVNDFFYDKLMAVPTIKERLESLRSAD
ncbi:MAG: hypothetical protein LC722_02240 [Actinobacteria bacterium]|nr:hypothetical protein [Actinomycetota bacterium]